MSKKVWQKPVAVRHSIKTATMGVTGSPLDDCGDGTVPTSISAC